jgi:16S rRNA (cytosine1402-N4)-methyltransferase
MHIPVLQKEVIKYLNPGPNDNFIDCTVGGGGHALLILQKSGPRGRVLGIDRDAWQIENCRSNLKDFKNRVILTVGNFADLEEIFKRTKFGPVSGILFDLGMSSWHLENSGRGFSFKKREPLDMRYDCSLGLNAGKIVNYWSKPELERIFIDFGQEKKAGRIARQIVEARKWRPLNNTLQLAGIATEVGADPAKIFQALRIAVNDELTNIKKALGQALDILRPGGRMAVISFHSLEDGITKDFFSARGGNQSVEILTKKPVVPGPGEIKDNPRARSAKLRAIKKI